MTDAYFIRRVRPMTRGEENRATQAACEFANPNHEFLRVIPNHVVFFYGLTDDGKQTASLACADCARVAAEEMRIREVGEGKS